MKNSMDDYYKITRNDVSYNPERDVNLESLFGTDDKFITKINEIQCYSITICLKSINPNHYTEYGLVKLLEKTDDPDSVKRTLSYLRNIKINGCNDHAKAARITFIVPTVTPYELQKLILFLKSLQNQEQILQEIGINSGKGSRIHLLRTKVGTNRPFKCIIKGVSKTLININTKDIQNAKAVSNIMQQQLGFDKTKTQWNRNISNRTGKFTTNRSVSSTNKCPKLKQGQTSYE